MAMKKLLSLLLAMLMLMTALPFAAFAEAAEALGDPVTFPDELIVGSPTAMKGDFFTEMFGNDSADLDLRSLIHGYNLVNWDQSQGVYVFDPTVVTDTRVTQDAAGNRSYFIALADDLFYSDGTPITAWDYAFSLLLMMSPEMEQIGAKIYRAEHLRGYADYISKRAQTLIGVEVLSDHQLVITLDADFLPFFYETGLLLCVPYPISVLAPGCRVYDDGNGVYIGNINQSITEPLFTADLLRQTILDPETGYNSHPSVVSGPYTLTSFDGTTAHLEVNPYYQGTWVQDIDSANEDDEDAVARRWPETLTVLRNDAEGNPIHVVTPSIGKIAFTAVNSDDVPQLFAEGRLHLVDKLVYGPAITALVQSADETNVRFQNELRVGMTMFTFSCEKPAVAETAVRQAIAWCMDREALIRDYTTGYGLRVDGYYGIGKWEYMLIDGQVEAPVTLLAEGESIPTNLTGFQNLYAANDAEYETMVAAWDALSLDGLTAYEVDTARAVSLLTEAGWTLNRDGGTYTAGTDDVRCKRVNGELVALDLSLMYPEGNHIADNLQAYFIDHLNEVGIRLTLVPASMTELLTSYYRETARGTDLIYLGTDFHVVYDPSITYATGDPALHEKWNNTFSDDEELYQLAVALRETQPGDIYGYITKWIAFQERYNEVLPSIPLYSNVYFDFFIPTLQNFEIGAHPTWGQAIVEAFYGEEPMEDTVEEEPEALGDDEAIFDD